MKVAIRIEETSLAYEPRRIDSMADENHDSASLAFTLNGKIQPIYEPNGPSATPLAVFE